MQSHRTDIAEFRRRAARNAALARARLSVRLLCGEDLDTALAGGKPMRLKLAQKLVRRLERERLKGLRGHWSYDLNRHIGLRQALDLVVGAETPPAKSLPA